MGMYTEIMVRIEVPKNIDSKAMAVLKYMFNYGDMPKTDELPDHLLFQCDRWASIGHCSSFYHHPEPVNSWVDVDYSSDIHIYSRSDLKNYDNEIDKFFNWISQYIDTEACIGYSWYEEDPQPTLYYGNGSNETNHEED